MMDRVVKERKLTKQIKVGNVPVGGCSPISIQSMTNTNTEDVKSTIKQVNLIQDAGADIVRISVPTMDAAGAFISAATQGLMLFPMGYLAGQHPEDLELHLGIPAK